MASSKFISLRCNLKLLGLMLVTLSLTTANALAVEMDKSFLGRWSLNVAKSDFGPGPTPKMGEVNWTKHGWSFALVTASDRLVTDAVVTERGCSLIGDPSDYTCTFTVVGPHRVAFTMKQGDVVRVVSEFELIDNDTTKVTHHRTPAQGRPFTEHATWERIK
jgi:hypothetical protein